MNCSKSTIWVFEGSASLQTQIATASYSMKGYFEFYFGLAKYFPQYCSIFLLMVKDNLRNIIKWNDNHNLSIGFRQQLKWEVHFERKRRRASSCYCKQYYRESSGAGYETLWNPFTCIQTGQLLKASAKKLLSHWTFLYIWDKVIFSRSNISIQQWRPLHAIEFCSF